MKYQIHLNYGLKFGDGNVLDDIKTFDIISKGTIKDDKNTITTIEIKVIY